MSVCFRYKFLQLDYLLMCKMEKDGAVGENGGGRGERAGFGTEDLASDTIMKIYQKSQEGRLSRCLLMWVS